MAAHRLDPHVINHKPSYPAAMALTWLDLTRCAALARMAANIIRAPHSFHYTRLIGGLQRFY